MNLGKRRLKNPELIAAFDEIGLFGAHAFLASGNVVFEATGKAATLERRLEKGLSEQLGYPVPTFVRSKAQIEGICDAQPFAARAARAGGASPAGKLQVALLRVKPSAATAKKVNAFDSAEDWLHIEGSELYWWPNGGLSQSELELAAIEKLLGPMTIRNHRTIVRLMDKHLT